MSNRFESFSQSVQGSLRALQSTTTAFWQRRTEWNRIEISFHVRVTHIEQSSRTRLSCCNENRAPASTRMKRRVAESVSIFLVYIMFARVNRNSRNYKARASCAFRTDSQYTVMVHARASFSPCYIAALIERLPASGVPSATLARFFIVIPAHYRIVDTSPANTWHRDARINSS